MGRKKKESPEETTVAKEAGGTTVSISADKLMGRLKDIEESRLEKKPIEIRAASIRDGMFCHYSYDHTVAANTTNDVSIKSSVPIHDDMRDAFKKLNAHLAVICEEITIQEVGDIDNLPYGDDHPLNKKINAFTVASFKIDGKEEKEGVILLGFKQLSTGDFLKLEAPKIKWSAGYQFINELRVAIHDCTIEVEEYMKGKQAPPAQQELAFDEAEAPYVEEDL
jgi:hypothetical protein